MIIYGRMNNDNWNRVSNSCKILRYSNIKEHPPSGTKQIAGQIAFFRKLSRSEAINVKIKNMHKTRSCIIRNGPISSVCIPNGIVPFNRW